MRAQDHEQAARAHSNGNSALRTPAPQHRRGTLPLSRSEVESLSSSSSEVTLACTESSWLAQSQISSHRVKVACI
eukprot:2824908-Rhodomonas_salina.1